MLAHLLIQWLRLTASVAGLLAFGGVAGWGATLLFLPGRFAFRWIVVTPVVGLAVVTVLGLPLSLLGLPVGTFVPGLMTSLAVCGLTATILLRRRHPLLRQKRALAYLRRRGLRLLVLSGLITSLSVYLMTVEGRTDVRDYWGLGDCESYWGVSDYLLLHGASRHAYETQTEFRSDDIRDHLFLHARLGNMVYLAEAASVFSSGKLYRVINPAIVAAMILIVGLGAVWLETIRCRAIWPLLIVACHPFLYFLLYFSYASQATGVLLGFAGFLLALEAAFGLLPGPAAVRAGIAAGLLLAAAMLHHPTIPPVIGVILLALVFATFRAPKTKRRWNVLLGLGLSLLATTFYYIPASWRELTFLSGAELRGWEWKRLIGFGEIAGFRTVLGYELPFPRTQFDWALDTAAGLFLIGGTVLAVNCRRSRLLVGTLGGASAALVAGTLLKVFQHVPNATHNYVKAVSLFVLILLLACLARWADALSLPSARRAGALVPLLVALWIPTELRAVRTGSFQPVHYTEAMVELVHRLVASGAYVTFQPDLYLDVQKEAPLVRDAARLDERLAPAGKLVAITRDRSAIRGDLVDRAGPYFAFRLPPAGIPESR